MSEAAPKLTPEQEEELKLRSRYPNPQKPGSSAFIQKLLNKGNKKYFDSGDYNMARSKMKSLNTKQPGTALQNQAPPQELPNHSDEEQQVTTTTTAAAAPVVSSEPVSLVVDSAASETPVVDVSVADTSNLNSSTLIDQQQQHHSELNAPETPVMTSQNVSRLDKTAGLNTTTSSTNLMHHVSSPLNTSSTTTTSNNISNSNTLGTPSLSSSVSTSSIQHLMSSSISSDKLSGIQLNPPLTSGSEYLDAEEIGHGIPTPECLPQSRKHSIAQSKLVANSGTTTTTTGTAASPATPRLSTS